MWIESLKSYYLQGFANQLSNVFIDAKKVTKSFILTVNILERIDVTKRKLNNECKAHLKQDRLSDKKIQFSLKRHKWKK